MRIREHLDKIVEKQHELNLLLARLTVTVEEHEKRSTNLEKYVSHLDGQVTHVKKHVDMINGFAKIFTGSVVVIGGILGILVAIKKFISLL